LSEIIKSNKQTGYCGQDGTVDQEAGSWTQFPQREVVIRDGATREQPMVQLRVSEEYRQERDRRALEETTVQTNNSTEAVVTHR